LLHASRHHRHLHSFPTRRSSDLAGAKIIDLSRMTVMPGLVDCHTHMFLHGIPYDEALLKKSLQYRAIWSTVAARKTLLAGFTTIDRKSTRLNSSHLVISYAVFCL